MENELERIIIKDKTLISCDNDNCKFYGDMWWCYLNNERNCGIYRDWEKRLRKKSLNT